MKQLPLILSIVALSLACVALYKVRMAKTSQPAVIESKNTGGNNFRIAYFEMDSIENNYQYVKDSYAQVKIKEEAINNELAGIDRNNRQKISEWQKKGTQMTQAETEQAQKEYAQMQQNYQDKRTSLEQELNDMRTKKLRNIQVKIEEYLKEYNKQKGYAYILSYEPAVFIYYKDSAYNITSELLKGLNEEYNKNKK